MGTKSLTEHPEVPGRRGFINITPTVEDLVTRSGVAEGLGLVNAMHVTASVFVIAASVRLVLRVAARSRSIRQSRIVPTAL